MRFFNIAEQEVVLIMPDGKSSVGLSFSQSQADAMQQRLIISTPGGGPVATLTFEKAGRLIGTAWNGLDEGERRADAAQLTDEAAKDAGLKPGQQRVNPQTGGVEQAPGKFVPPGQGGGGSAGQPGGEPNPPGMAAQGAVNTSGQFKADSEPMLAKAPRAGSKELGDPNA